MRPCLALKVSHIVALSITGLLLPAASKAQISDVSGRYQCAEAKVRGKAIPCTGAPLILKNAGKFELRGWEGIYLVVGHGGDLSGTEVRYRAKTFPCHKLEF